MRLVAVSPAAVFIGRVRSEKRVLSEALLEPVEGELPGQHRLRQHHRLHLLLGAHLALLRAAISLPVSASKLSLPRLQ